MSLDASELVCTGLIGINFSGNGYFSWKKEYSEYVTQYESAFPIVAAKNISKEMFPVKKDSRFAGIDEYLGKLFFNRQNYRNGDWILSIVES